MHLMLRGQDELRQWSHQGRAQSVLLPSSRTESTCLCLWWPPGSLGMTGLLEPLPAAWDILAQLTFV